MLFGRPSFPDLWGLDKWGPTVYDIHALTLGCSPLRDHAYISGKRSCLCYNLYIYVCSTFIPQIKRNHKNTLVTPIGIYCIAGYFRKVKFQKYPSKYHFEKIFSKKHLNQHHFEQVDSSQSKNQALIS